MAAGVHNTGSSPRLLQLGLDKRVDHYYKRYVGLQSEIFKKKEIDKGFFEALELTGMSLASIKGEGDVISMESTRQHWVFRWPVYTYEKSARFTMESLADNIYEDLLDRYGKEIAASIEGAKDLACANILNRAFNTDYTGPKAETLCITTHALADGTSVANRLTTHVDLSEDAIEQLCRVILNFKNNENLPTSYMPQDLIIHNDLIYEAQRILANPNRPGTANRDISALYKLGHIKDVKVWKRLTDTDAFFITTDCDEGFTLLQKGGRMSRSSEDIHTWDKIVSVMERFAPIWIDWRCVVGSAGI